MVYIEPNMEVLQNPPQWFTKNQIWKYDRTLPKGLHRTKYGSMTKPSSMVYIEPNMEV